MDAVTCNRRTAPTGRQSGIVHIDCIAHSRDAPPGPRARGNAARDRGVVEFGKQRAVVPQPLLVWIGLWPQAAAFHKSRDTPMNAARDAGDFSISRRGKMPKDQFAPATLNIEAVQGQSVEVRVEIRCITEALNEGDGAAAGLAVGRSFIAPYETGLVSASLDMRWELSYWGPNAKRVSASEASLESQLELENHAGLLVGAEVARNCLELRGIEDQLEAARRNRDNQAQFLELTRMRARAGLSPELDAERQAAALSSLEASIPLLELQRSLRMNALAVLLADRDFVRQPLAPAAGAPKLPSLNAGIDSELPLRRPDVRAAYAGIRAATARVKQARSELYPRLLLTCSAGCS